VGGEAVVVEPLQGAAVVKVFGRCDMRLGEDLDGALRGLVEKGQRHVLVDLSESTAIDSTFIGILFGYTRRLISQGGALNICHIPFALRETFEILRVGDFIPIFPDRKEALASGGPGGDDGDADSAGNRPSNGG